MQQRVLDGQLDLAIVALDLAVAEGLTARRLHSEPVLAALPHSHPLAGVRTEDLGRLRGDSFVLFRSGTGLRAITERAASDVGFTPRAVLETASLDRLVAFVSEGLGVSLIPEWIAQRVGPSVIARPLSQPLTLTVGLLSRADHSLSPSIRALRELLVSGEQVRAAAG